MNTLIKICGVTREADAVAVVNAGADALGLVFAPVSPRRVTVERAAQIARTVAGDVLRVGLFVDQPAAEIRRVLGAVQLDVLQFHGEESAEFCRQFGLPYLKAFRVAEAFDLQEARERYSDACCLLLDAFVPGVPGGTGQRLDEAHWPRNGARLVLAGGLTPGNVRAAVERLQPFAVDVSGGVEGPQKGEKDAEKIQRFVNEVRSAGR